MRIRDWSSDVCSSDLLRIVLDEGPAGVLLWDGVARAEVHHVEGDDRADVGKARADEGAEAVRVGGEHAAPPPFADFGGGAVHGGGPLAAVGPSLSRAPAAHWRLRAAERRVAKGSSSK